MTNQHSPTITLKNEHLDNHEIAARSHGSYSTQEFLLTSDPIGQELDILNDGADVFRIAGEDPLEFNRKDVNLTTIDRSLDEAEFEIEGQNDLINLCSGDVFYFQIGDGYRNVTGDDRIDAIRLEDADGGRIPMGWVYTLTSGSVNEFNDNSVTLSENSKGFIELPDGSRLDFSAIVRIEW